MNHPSNEELLLFLDGEGSLEFSAEMKEHMKECARCKATLEGWERSVRRLRALPFRPSVKNKAGYARGSQALTILKWAVAALLILSIGVGLGRFSRADERRIRAAITADVQHQVRAEMKADLAAAFGSGNATDDAFQVELRKNVQNAWFEKWIEKEKEERLGDRRYVLALINQLHDQHMTDFVTLRRDLETAASVADSDLEQNREKIAALTQTLFTQTVTEH